jgi:hypothetical protein
MNPWDESLLAVVGADQAKSYRLDCSGTGSSRQLLAAKAGVSVGRGISWSLDYPGLDGSKAVNDTKNKMEWMSLDVPRLMAGRSILKADQRPCLPS